MGMNMNPGAGSHPFPPSIVLRDVEPETDRVDDNLRRGLQRGLLLLVLLALVVLTTLWLTSVGAEPRSEDRSEGSAGSFVPEGGMLCAGALKICVCPGSQEWIASNPMGQRCALCPAGVSPSFTSLAFACVNVPSGVIMCVWQASLKQKRVRILALRVRLEIFSTRRVGCSVIPARDIQHRHQAVTPPLTAPAMPATRGQRAGPASLHLS